MDCHHFSKNRLSNVTLIFLFLYYSDVIILLKRVHQDSLCFKVSLLEYLLINSIGRFLSAGNKRARLDRRNQKDRDRRKNESEEEKNIRLAKRRQRDRARRADETPEQRGARLVKMSTQQQKRRASETPEARDARLEQLRFWYRVAS